MLRDAVRTSQQLGNERRKNLQAINNVFSAAVVKLKEESQRALSLTRSFDSALRSGSDVQATVGSVTLRGPQAGSVRPVLRLGAKSGLTEAQSGQPASAVGNCCLAARTWTSAPGSPSRASARRRR